MARGGKSGNYHERIRGVLADGRWHTLEEIFRAVARHIPKDTALREYAKRRTDPTGVTMAVRVASGRKRLTFLSLNSLIHHRQSVIARGRDWTRKYRLTAAAVAALGTTIRRPMARATDHVSNN